MLPDRAPLGFRPDLKLDHENRTKLPIHRPVFVPVSLQTEHVGLLTDNLPRSFRCETHAEEAEVEVQQRHEHEDQEDSASELQEVLRGTLMAERRNSCEHGARLPPTLRQEQQETPAQSQVPAGGSEPNYYLKV